ncbi:MAG: BON domain-containing protein [Hyphomonadaceae bacterium]|nr:BON domain-containing protein [Hyphomonadaceae bacterium]
MMRKLFVIAAAMAAASSVTGCMAAAAVGAAGVGLMAVQDRTIGQGIDDATASQEVKMRLLATDRAGYAEVDVEVANGALLLSGPAPSEQHRQTAEMVARSVASVHTVYNEIVVGPPSSLARSAQDELITAQIRTRFAASNAVRAVNINIETYSGNVYLMGTARSDHELQRAAEIAASTPGVRRVVSFMQVLAPRGVQSYAASLPPTPEYRGDDLAGGPTR